MPRTTALEAPPGAVPVPARYWTAAWVNARGLVSVVAILMLVAVALRWLGFQETLTGDEIFTFDDVHGRGLFSMLHYIEHNGENTPPLFFVLAWIAVHVGDPAETVRLPSIVLGAATVPLVYLLGRRTVGRGAGLLAAALFALDPLAVWQGSEARAYATLMFLTALSALMLVLALEDSRRWSRWWIAYAVSVAAVAYTHYTGFFVLAAQTLWAAWFYRDRWRELAAAAAGAAVLYVPWIPHYHGSWLAVFNALGVPLVPEKIAHTILQSAITDPEIGSFSQLPGTAFIVLFLAALGLSLGLLPVAWRRSPPFSGRQTRLIVLIALLAVANPIGVPAYSAIGYDILLAHALAASLPFELLFLAFLILTLRRLHTALAVLTGAAVVATIAVGAWKMATERPARADYRTAYAFAMAHGSAGDTIVDESMWPLSRAFAERVPVYFSHHVTVTNGGTPAAGAGFARARSGEERVFVVVSAIGWLRNYRPPRFAGNDTRCSTAKSAATAPPDCVALRATRTFRGLMPLIVSEYWGR